MAINRTGFEATSYGLNIVKDPEATLTYTLDWGTWLEAADSISSIEVSAASRSNDPDPIVVEGSGIVGDKTYARLSGGVAGKSYVVTTKCTTTEGLIDRRAYRVHIENRQG